MDNKSQTESPIGQSTKRCRWCRVEIESLAIVCNACGHSQGVTGWFQSHGAFTLLTVLLSVFAAGVAFYQAGQSTKERVKAEEALNQAQLALDAFRTTAGAIKASHGFLMTMVVNSNLDVFRNQVKQCMDLPTSRLCVRRVIGKSFVTQLFNIRDDDWDISDAFCGYIDIFSAVYDKPDDFVAAGVDSYEFLNGLVVYAEESCRQEIATRVREILGRASFQSNSEYTAQISFYENTNSKADTIAGALEKLGFQAVITPDASTPEEDTGVPKGTFSNATKVVVVHDEGEEPKGALVAKIIESVLGKGSVRIVVIPPSSNSKLMVVFLPKVK